MRRGGCLMQECIRHTIATAASISGIQHGLIFSLSSYTGRTEIKCTKRCASNSWRVTNQRWVQMRLTKETPMSLSSIQQEKMSRFLIGDTGADALTDLYALATPTATAKLTVRACSLPRPLQDQVLMLGKSEREAMHMLRERMLRERSSTNQIQLQQVALCPRKKEVTL